MMLDFVIIEYFQSVRKTKYSKLKESLEAGPRTHVGPTNGFQSTVEVSAFITL